MATRSSVRNDVVILYESSWHRAAALQHGKPLDETRGHAKRRERYGVCMRRSLVIPATRYRTAKVAD